MALKWKFDGDFSFADENFAKIYRFYVIETPVCDVSARGKTFKERQVNMVSLCAALKRETPFLKEKWLSKSKKEVEGVCKDNNIYRNFKLPNEIVIHTENGIHCGGKTDSLFYAIRCSLAHGSFAIHVCDGEKYYVLENMDKDILKARMIVKETSLLKWIEVIESQPRPSKKTTKRK